MNYLEKVDEITCLLLEANEHRCVNQLSNAKLMGGTGGEIFSIICSLLKTYEIVNPSIFSIIRKPAEELFIYAESIGYRPSANFHLLDELSN